ncbi:hypothetical protein [Leifsonia sp. LS1]|uniref:hypothetical protein n=1 Tax=Leifsonia sp. LS1 TaxID=2828483 RepID=UPI001CFC8B4F|nr:hypothetical protein [Leifsonia sp. LS1]
MHVEIAGLIAWRWIRTDGWARGRGAAGASGASFCTDGGPLAFSTDPRARRPAVGRL